MAENVDIQIAPVVLTGRCLDAQTEFALCAELYMMKIAFSTSMVVHCSVAGRSRPIRRRKPNGTLVTATIVPTNLILLPSRHESGERNLAIVACLLRL